MAGWTDEELEACVVEFLRIRDVQSGGGRVVKAQIYKELAAGPVSDRTWKSVELRMQNISSVLMDFGLPFPAGLKPLHNVGPGVRPRIYRMLRDRLAPDQPLYAPTRPGSRYMRICWNSAGWQRPTGEAASLEEASYVAQHGFGWEEWLFDWRHVLKRDGRQVKYGFLQPANSAKEALEGQTIDLLLYTKTPGRTVELVARVDGVYFPGADERRWALEAYRARGWFRDMRDQVAALTTPHDLGVFEAEAPDELLNVRFDPLSVHLLRPPPTVHRDKHKIVSTHRYVPMVWDDDMPPLDWAHDPSPRAQDIAFTPGQGTDSGPLEVSDDDRQAIVDLVTRALEAQYGADAVRRGPARADVRLELEERVTLFGVSEAASARGCVSERLGHLLDAAHHPSAVRAHSIVVVGEAVADAQDLEYLGYLRGRFGLKVSYARWLVEEGTLEPWRPYPPPGKSVSTRR